MTEAASRRIDTADIERARAIRLAEVAHERGLALKRAGGELVGPCPLCGGRDRFAIHLGKDAFHCRGCDAGGKGAISFVIWLDGCGFREAIESLVGRISQVNRNAVHLADAPAQGSKEHDRRQRAKADWLWSQREPIRGTVAEVYLRETRGIACPLPGTLAFLPPSKPEHHPAMIAAFGLGDEVVAVHLTLLKPDGSGKADIEPNKIMIGSPSGRPIVIAEPTDLLGLAITEGVEDGLSIHQATGLGVESGASKFAPVFERMFL